MLTLLILFQFFFWQGVDVDNDELEGIRNDVRTLRTDLGLNLEFKNKTEDEEEGKEKKGMKVKLNSNMEKKKISLIAYDGKIDSSSNSDSDVTHQNGDNIIATKVKEESTTTELNEGLELNLESRGDRSPDGFDDEREFDINVEMFTPSILLLVDEIAALEKDILKRHTDVTIATAAAATQVPILLYLLLLIRSL